MIVRVTNAQDEAPVRVGEIKKLACGAIHRLRIRAAGEMAITFVDSRRMRFLNKRFKQQDWATDVLSFRYDGEPIVGEVLISPKQARQYAQRHGIPYRQELSRYVVHGLLHWLGYEDRTAAQQKRMRRREDGILRRLGLLR